MFAEKLFSIKEYSETHFIIYLLGLKFKFQKYEYAKKLKQSPYDRYRKNNVSITTLPPATGQIRDIQLANLAILKEFDSVCRKNGLQYWLDFGTMLGCVRHKGFIPWDDDIDVGMMRDDYNKIINLFNSSTQNADLYAEKTFLGRGQTIIKIKHKKCDYIFLDIFAHDYLNDVLTKEDRLKLDEKLYNIRKKLNKNPELINSEKIDNIVNQIKSEIIENKFVEHSDIIAGLEYFHYQNQWVHTYNSIFPLKEITFENFSAFGVNNPDEYLTDLFGNYMSYPKKIGMGHSAYAKIPDEQYKIIKQMTANNS